MILETVSHARAGLIGNPSDGYFGKTLSFTLTNFTAKVTMWESPDIQFLPNPADDAVFEDLDQLMNEILLYGYYGGIRLLKATTKVFVDYCNQQNISLPKRNFSVQYDSDIPRLGHEIRFRVSWFLTSVSKGSAWLLNSLHRYDIVIIIAMTIT